MNKTKVIKLNLQKFITFFALTAFFTMVSNLPAILLSNNASAATASAYTLTALTTTDISVSASDFKVMEFVVPDSDAGTQDTLLLDGANLSYDGDSLVSFPADVMFIDQGGGTGFQSGDDIVKDLDGDGVYTSGADYLVDADGTTSTTTTVTALSAGAALYDIETTDYLFTDSLSSPTKLWQDKDHDSHYTAVADTFVDGDGFATSGRGVEPAGISGDSSFANFASGDQVYYYDDSGATTLDGLEDVDALWLDSGNGYGHTLGGYDVAQNAVATASGTLAATTGYAESENAITDYFIIDNSNDAFVINVSGGLTGDQTITIATGSYTGDELAVVFDAALESATDLTDGNPNDVAVTYDETTDLFTITNNFASDFDLKWNDGSSEAQDVLGYSNLAADTLTASGGTAISDNAVAFNIITGTNDQLDITVDGVLQDDVTLSAGVYTGATLATELQTQLRAATTSTETVVYASDKFKITSATVIAHLTTTRSSIEIAAGGNDASDTFDFGAAVESAGLSFTDGVDDTLMMQLWTYDSINGTTLTNETWDFGTTTFYTIDEVDTAFEAKIAAGGYAGKITVTVPGDVLTLTSVGTGFGNLIKTNGGLGEGKFGFGVGATYVDGGDSLIYDGAGLVGGEVGTLLVSPASGSTGLRYHDISGSASGYQSGEAIYIDTGYMTYSATADALLLDNAGNIAAGATGTNVANTATWVKSVDHAYVDGDDIFIENVSGEHTYSAAADTMLVNGSFGSASLGATLVAFDADQKFVDNDSDGTYDAGEDIYENAPLAGGTTVEYEAINDITVSNGASTNAVGIANIIAVKMFYEENTGTPTFDGTEDYITFEKYPVADPAYWRATGKNIQIPDDNGLKVYITVTVNSSISEGQKIRFQLDMKSDAGSDGIYQAGDRGLFVSTNDDGPSDQAVQSTEVTVSAFGDLFNDLEDAIDDFEKEIEDVRDPDDDDTFDDYADDSEEYLDDLEDALAVTIDTNTEVSDVFDSLNDLIDVMGKHVSLIQTSGEYAITDREYEDVDDALDAVKSAMDAIVSVLDDMVEADEDLSSSSFNDEESDYDDNYDDVEDALIDKDPEGDDIEGVIRYIEGLVDDLDDIINDDVPSITVSGGIDDTDDIFDDVIDVLNDAKKKVEDMSDSEDYDEDDLDDLENIIDDLKDKSDDVYEDVNDKIVELADADLIDDFDDEEYDEDIDEMNDKIKDAFDLLSGAEVSSEDVDNVIDNLEEIEDDVNDLSDTVDDLVEGISENDAESIMDDVFDDLIDAYKDATDEIGSLPCTTSDDDMDEVSDAADDIMDAVKDMRSYLEDSLNDVGHMDALSDDFEDYEDDLKDEKDSLEEEISDIEDLEGRCEDTDESGPASVVVVSNSYTLSVDDEGVDTATIVATVRDKSSQLLDNRVVEFTISSPLSNEGKLSSGSQRTNTLGQVEVEYTPGANTNGKVTVKVYSATNPDVSGTVQLNVVNVQAGYDDDDNSTIEEDIEDDDDNSTIEEDTDDDDDSVIEEDVEEEGAEPATLGVVDSVLDPAQGGTVKVHVTSEDGGSISGEQVTLSLRSSTSGSITSYTAVSDKDGMATFSIPQTDFAPNEEYAAIVSSVTAPQTTSGIFEIKSDEASVNTGNGEGQVLGVSDSNSGENGGATKLPTTGVLPLVTFAFSSIGSALLVFRREEE